MKKNRIEFTSIVILIVTAILIDILNLIPILGGIVSTFYWMFVSLYLWKTGHGLINWRSIIPESISVIIEWIPALSFIPTVFISTVIIIIISRVEDKTGISITLGGKTAGITPKRSTRVPVNGTPGIRPPRITNDN